MTFRFEQLDSTTRALMLEELQIDLENDSVRVADRLNNSGKNQWVEILINAINHGDDRSLESSITDGKLLVDRLLVNFYSGERWSETADDEASRISQNAFNRYYARAICRRAINEKAKYVEIYLAKPLHSDYEKLLQQSSDGKKLEFKTAGDFHTNKSIDKTLDTIGKRIEAVPTLDELRGNYIGRAINGAISVGIGPGIWSLKLIG